MRQHLLRALQIGVTVGLLVWLFWDAESRREMALALRRADLFWIGMGLLVAVIGDVANLVRWGVFLRAQEILTPWWKIAWLFMTGLFFNLFLFGPTGGDLVRIFYLAREEREKRTAVVLTVVADRMIGLLVLIPFALVIVVLRYDWLSQTPVARALLYFLIAFLVGSLVVMGGASLVAATGWMEKLPAHFPFRNRLVKIATTYHVFARRWKASLLALLLSLPVVFSFFGTFYCAARAFGAKVSLYDFFSIMPAVTVISSFPISISGLGVREKLFEDLLRDLAGVPGELGVVISLTGFTIYLFWSLVGALIYVLFNPYHLVSVQEIQRADGERSDGAS